MEVLKRDIDEIDPDNTGSWDNRSEPHRSSESLLRR